MAIKVSKIISINELNNNEPSAESLVLLRKNDVDGYSTVQQLEDYFSFVKQDEYQEKVAELEAADAELQNIVANEVRTQLSSEITARQTADNTLQESIDSLNTTMTQSVNAETSARQTKDNELQTAISSLSTSTTQSINTLRSDLEANIANLTEASTNIDWSTALPV